MRDSAIMKTNREDTEQSTPVQKATPVQKNTPIDTSTPAQKAAPVEKSRREFIKKSLKRTVGIYLGMTIIDAFTGPKFNMGGMPIAAASTGSGSPTNGNDNNDVPARW